MGGLPKVPMPKKLNLKQYQWGVPATQDIYTQQTVFMRLVEGIITDFTQQDVDVLCITLQCLALLKLNRRTFFHHGHALRMIISHVNIFSDALDQLYDLIETDNKRDTFFNALNNALHTLKHPETKAGQYFSNEITHFKIKKETDREINAAYQHITDNLHEYFPFPSTFKNEILSFTVDDYIYRFRVKFTNDKKLTSTAGFICITSLKNFDQMLKFITAKSLEQVLRIKYQEQYGNILELSFENFNKNKIYNSLYELIVLYVKTKQTIENNDKNLAKITQDDRTRALVARNENLREKAASFSVFSKGELPGDFDFMLESLQIAISQLVLEQETSDSLNCSPMTMASMSLTDCHTEPQSLSGSPLSFSTNFSEGFSGAGKSLPAVTRQIIELPLRVNLQPNMLPFPHTLNEDLSVLSVTVNNIGYSFAIQQTQAPNSGAANNENCAQFIAFKVFVFLLAEIYKENFDDLATLDFENFDEKYINICGLLNRYFIIKEIIKENKQIMLASSSGALNKINLQLERISETFEAFCTKHEPQEDPKGLDYYRNWVENVRIACFANPASQATKFFYYKSVDEKKHTTLSWIFNKQQFIF